MTQYETQSIETHPTANTDVPVSLLATAQAQMSQYLDLLRGQQQLMQQCLDFQQRLFVAPPQAAPLSSPGETFEVPMPPAPAATPPVQAVPPAPVLPSFPVLPSTPPPPAAPAPSVPMMPVPAVESPIDPPRLQTAENGTTEPTSTETFQTTLLRIVSERTGYPEDMFDLDANLEADLGVDSIKRVEIFGTLGENQQLFDGYDEETLLVELMSLNTLRDIVTWYDNKPDQRDAEPIGTEKKSL